MKILLATPHDVTAMSGLNKQVFGLRHALRAQGHDTHLVGRAARAFAGGEGVYSFFSAPGLERGQLAALLARERFDAVHLFDPLASPLTTHLLALADPSRLVLSFLSNAAPSAAPRARRWLEKWHQGRQRRHLAGAAKRVTASRALQNSLKQGLALSSRVIPIGVDGERFYPKARAVNAPLRLLFVGDWSKPERGFGLLREALAGLRSPLPIDLDLVGRGDARAASACAGLPNVQVEHVGAVSELKLPQVYQRADVLVAPALDASVSGAVVLEAMACGAAVICSDVTPHHELAAGSGALLFAAGDARALTAQLARLLTRPDERARRGEANAATARCYGWDALVEAWQALYAELEAPRVVAATPYVAAPNTAPALRLAEGGIANASA